MFFPTDMYTNIMKYLLQNKASTYVDSYVLSTCNTTLYPSIYLRLNDTWFEVRPGTFVVNATVADPSGTYAGMCALAIMPHSSDLIILGVPFLKNYYMIFNADNDTLGISSLYGTSK